MLLRALALAALLLAGCDHRPEDFRTTRQAVATFETDWGAKLDELSKRNQALTDRAQQVPPGTTGLDAVLAALDDVKARLGSLTARVDSIAADATARLDARQRRLADNALRVGARDLQSEVAGLQTTLDELDVALAAAEKAATEAARTAAEPPPPPPPDGPAQKIADAAFARATGSAVLTGVEFKTGMADLELEQPGTRAALETLVAFAGTCPELRFEITVHTARDTKPDVDQKVAEARAHAVRNYLVSRGIPEERIAKVAGVGGTQPLVPEPEPGSAEEKEMDVEQLKAIRAQNRRVAIDVVVPCPAQS
jgi:outer membrane protein OmpA-like peptidoglycan-associated protein